MKKFLICTILHLHGASRWDSKTNTFHCTICGKELKASR